jgi:predicted methyltransferase
MPRTGISPLAFPVVMTGMLILTAIFAMWGYRAIAASPDFAAVIAAPDRSDADRQTDKRRNPAQLLAFTGVETGMTVLDMGAGGGYSTELLASSWRVRWGRTAKSMPRMRRRGSGSRNGRNPRQ